MNSDELIAKDFFEARGHEVRTHPLGRNHPPDLLLDGKIAVEVRRLNLHIDTPNGPIPLETGNHKITGHLTTLFKSLGYASKSSWHVIANFKRPIGEWKKLKPKIIEACLRVSAEESSAEKVNVERISNGIELIFIRSSSKLTYDFMLAIPNDLDEGCLVHEALLKNTLLCIRQKQVKICPHKEKFSSWWIALIDHIDYCLSKEEWSAVGHEISEKNSWDKIVAISPLNSRNFIEI